VGKDWNVVVVGVGALGNAVVQNLGLIGVRKVVVVDPDVVEERNLESSVLLRGEGAVGRNKALVMAEVAGRVFPETEWVALDREIADVGFGVVAQAEVVFGCVDNELARLEMAYIGTKLDRPVCDGGLGAPDHWHGRVSWFPGRGAACYGCGLTAEKRRELLTTWDSPVHACWTAEDAPVRLSTPTMAALVGAMQVDLGLRGGEEAASFEVWLEPEPRMEKIGLGQSEACPFHGAEERLVEATGDGVGDLLAGDGEPVLVLDWPVCVEAECLECHKRWHPGRRVGWLRRRGACPDCGSRQVRDLETLTRVDRESVWASVGLSELGLPEDHLHTIRFETGR
jgi:molybdopterin/thiamine biosynthesis adenylyltransferase